MQKKASLQKNTTISPVEVTLTNAKMCEQCGATNTFKRVKCEQCGHLLPEGNFERSRRMREQSLRRERQMALSSTLFRDRPLIPDDSDDTADGSPAPQGASRGKKGSSSPGPDNNDATAPTAPSADTHNKAD